MIVDLAASPFARIGVAVAVILGGWIIGKVLQKILEPRLTRRRTPSFGRVMSKMVSFGFTSVAVIAAITIVFPSVQPVDFLAGLGVFSIAAGFAFQDILSNLLAGLLLIIRQPFQQGDQIEVNGHTGTVEGISIRETTIKTFDGQRVIVPNADVYQSAIQVKTAFASRRTSIVVGVGYEDDLDQAETAIIEACASVDGVGDDPAPQAFLTDLGDNAVNFDLRYWTDPHQADVRRIQHLVVKAVKNRLDAEGIDMPFPVRTLNLPVSALDAISGRRNGSSRGGSDGGTDDGLVDLDELTKDELYELAQRRDIDGRSTMNRDDLQAALQDGAG